MPHLKLALLLCFASVILNSASASILKAASLWPLDGDSEAGSCNDAKDDTKRKSILAIPEKKIGLATGILGKVLTLPGKVLAAKSELLKKAASTFSHADDHLKPRATGERIVGGRSFSDDKNNFASSNHGQQPGKFEGAGSWNDVKGHTQPRATNERIRGGISINAGFGHDKNNFASSNPVQHPGKFEGAGSWNDAKSHTEPTAGGLSFSADKNNFASSNPGQQPGKFEGAGSWNDVKGHTQPRATNERIGGGINVNAGFGHDKNTFASSNPVQHPGKFEGAGSWNDVKGQTQPTAGRLSFSADKNNFASSNPGQHSGKFEGAGSWNDVKGQTQPTAGGLSFSADKNNFASSNPGQHPGKFEGAGSWNDAKSHTERRATDEKIGGGINVNAGFSHDKNNFASSNPVQHPGKFEEAGSWNDVKGQTQPTAGGLSFSADKNNFASSNPGQQPGKFEGAGSWNDVKGQTQPTAGGLSFSADKNNFASSNPGQQPGKFEGAGSWNDVKGQTQRRATDEKIGGGINVNAGFSHDKNNFASSNPVQHPGKFEGAGSWNDVKGQTQPTAGGLSFSADKNNFASSNHGQQPGKFEGAGSWNDAKSHTQRRATDEKIGGGVNVNAGFSHDKSNFASSNHGQQPGKFEGAGSWNDAKSHIERRATDQKIGGGISVNAGFGHDKSNFASSNHGQQPGKFEGAGSWNDVKGHTQPRATNERIRGGISINAGFGHDKNNFASSNPVQHPGKFEGAGSWNGVKGQTQPTAGGLSFSADKNNFASSNPGQHSGKFEGAGSWNDVKGHTQPRVTNERIGGGINVNAGFSHDKNTFASSNPVQHPGKFEGAGSWNGVKGQTQPTAGGLSFSADKNNFASSNPGQHSGKFEGAGSWNDVKGHTQPRVTNERIGGGINVNAGFSHDKNNFASSNPVQHPGKFEGAGSWNDAKSHTERRATDEKIGGGISVNAGFGHDKNTFASSNHGQQPGKFEGAGSWNDAKSHTERRATDEKIGGGINVNAGFSHDKNNFASSNHGQQPGKFEGAGSWNDAKSHTERRATDEKIGGGISVNPGFGQDKNNFASSNPVQHPGKFEGAGSWNDAKSHTERRATDEKIGGGISVNAGFGHDKNTFASSNHGQQPGKFEGAGSWNDAKSHTERRATDEKIGGGVNVNAGFSHDKSNFASSNHGQQPGKFEGAGSWNDAKSHIERRATDEKIGGGINVNAGFSADNKNFASSNPVQHPGKFEGTSSWNYVAGHHVESRTVNQRIVQGSTASAGFSAYKNNFVSSNVVKQAGRIEGAASWNDFSAVQKRFCSSRIVKQAKSVGPI